MPRNGSGTEVIPNTFTPSTVISSSAVNANFTDVANELTNSLALDGQSVMTGQIKAEDGLVSAPAYAFGSALTTGFYLSGGDIYAAKAGVSLGAVVNPFTFYSSGASTGTTDYLVPTLSPSGFTLTAGRRVVFVIGNTNTTVTNNLNAGGTSLKPIVKRATSGNVPLAIGDLVAGELGDAVYDGTSWVLSQNVSQGFGPQVTLASATSTDLGTISSHNVLVSGTTAITGFGSSANVSAPLYLVTFSNILTLTHAGGTLNLPGAANIATVAGDYCWATYNDSGQWTVFHYIRASGKALIETSPYPSQTGKAGYVLTTDGSNPAWDSKSVTAATTFAGATGTQVSGAKNVASLTRNSTGFYSLVFTTNLTANYQVILTVEDPTNMPIFKITSRAVSGFNIVTTLSNALAQDFANVNVIVIGGL